MKGNYGEVQKLFPDEYLDSGEGKGQCVFWLIPLTLKKSLFIFLVRRRKLKTAQVAGEARGRFSVHRSAEGQLMISETQVGVLSEEEAELSSLSFVIEGQF